MLRSWMRRSRRLGWLAVGGLVVGCSSMHSDQKADYDPRMAPPLRIAAVPPMIGMRPTDESPIRTVSYQEGTPQPLPVHVNPPPAAAQAAAIVARRTATAGGPEVPGTVTEMPAALAEAPASLQAILQMTEARNAQIALARKRVEEAAAAECNAQACQLSRILCSNAASGGEDGLGGGGRHAAAARTWQRRAELARTTNETLLDAGNTYIDLLTARRGEAIGHELEKYQQDLLRRAEDLAKSDRSAAVLVESIRTEISGRHATLARLHQQAESAAAKLAYLLDQPPESPVIPQDVTLEPLDLVDASPAASVLIERAQSSGPGVRELTGLLATIEEAINSVHPCLARLPRVARQLQLAQFKLEETRLALDDLRGKLAAGVIDARGAILSGREQINMSAETIRHAAETYRLSDMRLKQNAPGAASNDVSQSIRGLDLAHFAHLGAVAAYDKAQLRLLLLLGYEPACPAPGPLHQ